MNASKTKTSHIITTGKKPPEKEHRLGPGGSADDQLKLDGFVDKLTQYADRNSDGQSAGDGGGGGGGWFKKPSQFNSALEEIKQRISGPRREDAYGSFLHDDVSKLGFELVEDEDEEEESEWAAFAEEPAEDRVEVVNLVFAPEAAEDSDGSPVKIFPASELEKLKVILVDTALFYLIFFQLSAKFL